MINGFDIDVIESSDSESEVGDPEVWAPARLFRALSAHGWVANYQVSSLTQFIFFFNFNIKAVRHSALRPRAVLTALTLLASME